MTSNKYIEYLLILAIILFFLPYLSLGFSTNDDAFNQVYHSWNDFKDDAFKQGRIQFFLFHWLIIKLSFLVESMIFIKILSITFILTNIFYIAFFLAKITSQKYYSYIFIIVFVTFLQDSWDHFLLTSSPIIYTVGFSLFLASLHLYVFHNEKKINLIVSAMFLVLALQISEMFFLFCIFYPIFSKFYLYKNIFYRLRYHIIFSAIYLFIYIVFRMIYNSGYSGNSVNGFSLISFLKTLFIYSVYTLPSSLFLSNSIMSVGDINDFLNYPFDFNLSLNPLSKFTHNIKIILADINEINVYWIIKYLLFIFIVFESLKKINRLEKKTIGLIVVIAVLLLFIPNVLHSLTNKYQEWALLGNSKGYVGTYFSYFGMSLLLTFLIVFAKNIGWFNKPTALSRLGLSFIIFILFFVSTFVSISNETIFNQKKQSHYRWVLMDKFFKTDVFKQLKEGDNIYTLGLMDRIGIVDKYQPIPTERSDYWDRYVLMKTGKKIHVFDGYPDNISGNNNYVLKLIQPKTDYDTFAIFAKINKSSKLIGNFYLLATAKKTSVLSYETQEAFKMLPFRLKGRKDYLLIKDKNVSVNSIWVEHQLRNRKDITVFAKPMKKGSIYTDKIEYKFLDGFYIEESSGMNTWHWSQKESQLMIKNNADDATVVQLKFLLLTRQKKESNITVFKDMENKKIVKGRNKDKEIILSFNLEPGKNIIHFVADESAKMPEGVDTRELYFYVKNLIVTETR